MFFFPHSYLFIFFFESLTFAKAISELLGSTFAGNMQLDKWFFWIIILCLVFFIVSQVHFLNKALGVTHMLILF